MANLLNIEKSKYITSQIEYHHKLKLGQYSKFLNKNLVYCTYLSKNTTMTRTDVGTGGVQNEIGKDSPIRFNKILNFPLFNLPEMIPELDVDEVTGADIQLELSEVVILPNTVHPTPSDYIIIDFPGRKKCLFRINNVAYNSIESKDFYRIAMDIYMISNTVEEIINFIEPQVVETYQTIYENIGTQDKCIIKLDAYDKAAELDVIMGELRSFYKSEYYDISTNSFVLHNNTDYPGYWFYDYLTSKFINEGKIFYDTYSDNCIVPTYNDNVPRNVDAIFMKTLWYAVLTRDVKYLNEFNYYYQSEISFRISSFHTMNIPCNGLQIHIGDSKASNTCLKEYFPLLLVQQILGTVPNIDDLESNIPTDYLELIIYNFMTKKEVTIEYSKIISSIKKESVKTYWYIPIIIYIINTIYKEYFKSENI